MARRKHDIWKRNRNQSGQSLKKLTTMSVWQEESITLEHETESKVGIRAAGDHNAKATATRTCTSEYPSWNREQYKLLMGADMSKRLLDEWQTVRSLIRVLWLLIWVYIICSCLPVFTYNRFVSVSFWRHTSYNIILDEVFNEGVCHNRRYLGTTTVQNLLNHWHSLGKFYRWQIGDLFLTFPRKKGVVFSCKKSP